MEYPSPELVGFAAQTLLKESLEDTARLWTWMFATISRSQLSRTDFPRLLLSIIPTRPRTPLCMVCRRQLDASKRGTTSSARESPCGPAGYLMVTEGWEAMERIRSASLLYLNIARFWRHIGLGCGGISSFLADHMFYMWCVGGNLTAHCTSSYDVRQKVWRHLKARLT